LAWTEAGNGPPLLCHPGGPGASARYFGGLAELAVERTLLRLDPRGTGDSDRPADPHAYDLADYADDVEGGFVAMTWASSHSDHVRRLVLANTAARFTDEIRQARSAMVTSYADEPWYDEAVAALEDHEAGRYADDAELALLLERDVPFLFNRWGEEEQATGRLLADRMNSEALRHFNERVAGGMDLCSALAGVHAQTLVITGEHDFFGESTARELGDALPNATVVVLPDAGHFVFGEARSRQAWARAILDFLSGDSG
jgi:proline iminopeptidase